MPLSAAQRKHFEKRLLDERARALRVLTARSPTANGDERIGE